MSKVRVLLVDDHIVVREGFVAMLSVQGDMQVVGEGQNGLEAVSLARKLRPDVILLDLKMPEQDGLTTIPILKEILPQCGILVLTSFDESDMVYQAVKAGAIGYLLKDCTRDQLLQAIRDVSNGQASLSPSIALKMIHEINHPAEPRVTADPLTPRELETLRLIARGMSNKEIAETLVLSVRTIAKYVTSILGKLQLASRTQAALYALHEGLAVEEDEQPDDEEPRPPRPKAKK
jgi:NarL family two-component system response regulator LiaR